MIALPFAAMAVSLVCAGVVGWDAIHRPRPDRASWAIAFLVFALAAGAEVVGSTLGWTESLARVYYLAGAVLVVGILALGELFLLLGSRMPAIAPGVSLLVVALATTVVWSAPIDPVKFTTQGWAAIERGPVLIALAASINAAGTIVLVGGALYSALRLRNTEGSRRRAAGCLLIAVGAIVVALGGTLTRFGQREYLYLAMTAGISIIFLGVLLTRARHAPATSAIPAAENDLAPEQRTRLTILPTQRERTRENSGMEEGIRFICESILPLSSEEIAGTCRQWGATPLGDDPLTREQAARVWSLRCALPDDQKARFDQLALPAGAQLAELYAEIWSDRAADDRGERHG